jgi:mannose-6-phosphate isomerase-like protein (cupin superfamily)
MTLTRYADIPVYVTKDGSEIRELMHPACMAIALQSLAEATVHPGQRTQLHRHARTEELYHVSLRSRLDDPGRRMFRSRRWRHGAHRAGTPHCIEALGEEPLRILCCCAPAYAHEDTELLEGDTPA